MQTYSLNLIRLLSENAYEGILLIDTSGIIRFANPSAVKMFRYAPEELDGQAITTITDELDVNNFIIENLDVFSKNFFDIGNQHKGKRKDKTEIFFDLNIVEIHLEDGEKMFLYRLHSISCLFENNGKDVSFVNQAMLANTDLKNKISQLSQTNQKLRNDITELLSAKEFNKNLNDIKSVFISTVSDNFRSPLSSILSSAQLISKYQKTEEQKNRERHLKKIENTVNNLNDTLSELLSCKQLDEDKIIFNSEEFDIRDLVNDVIAESKFIEKKDTEITYEHDGNGTHLITDQSKLRDIIENLVTNALKYSNGKGVNVYSKFLDEKLYLRVKDYGIGIPKTDQPHIFRRFYRAGNVSGTKGNGIGLSLVKKYVDSMNGHIQLQSEVNQGTEINVALPAIIVPA